MFYFEAFFINFHINILRDCDKMTTFAAAFVRGGIRASSFLL